MLVVDLFSGTGAATKAFKDRGHRVITVDIDPKLRPDIVADIRHFPLRNLKPDFVWASPPCTEFSKFNQPGIFPNPPWPESGLELIAATQDAIASLNPRFWTIENVKGAQRFLGRPTKRCRSFLLWGRFPPFDGGPVPWKNAGRRSAGNHYIHPGAARLAAVPRQLSLALCMALERDLA